MSFEGDAIPKNDLTLSHAPWQKLTILSLILCPAFPMPLTIPPMMSPPILRRSFPELTMNLAMARISLPMAARRRPSYVSIALASPSMKEMIRLNAAAMTSPIRLAIPLMNARIRFTAAFTKSGARCPTATSRAMMMSMAAATIFGMYSTSTWIAPSRSAPRAATMDGMLATSASHRAMINAAID